MTSETRQILYPSIWPRVGRIFERIALVITGSLALGFALCAGGIYLVGLVAI